MNQPPSYIQANVNGRLQDAREPALSPLDRGFLYGDAAYEVWRTYHGTLFAFDEHWSRLEQTADGLGLRLPFGPKEAFTEISSTAGAWRESTGCATDEIYVRLQITRGGGLIGLDTALADEPTFAIYVKAQPDAPASMGLRLRISRNWRRNSMEALPPTLKTGNYLNNIQGLREARECGADDALFLNAHGRLTEASTRNLWFVFKDRISTPPVSDGLLSGITRGILLKSAAFREDRPLIEESLDPEQIVEAEECFLTSTTQDVQPVASIDDREFSTGSETHSARLKQSFAEYAATYAREHPELKL